MIIGKYFFKLPLESLQNYIHFRRIEYLLVCKCYLIQQIFIPHIRTDNDFVLFMYCNFLADLLIMHTLFPLRHVTTDIALKACRCAHVINIRICLHASIPKSFSLFYCKSVKVITSPL